MIFLCGSTLNMLKQEATGSVLFQIVFNIILSFLSTPIYKRNAKTLCRISQETKVMVLKLLLLLILGRLAWNFLTVSKFDMQMAYFLSLYLVDVFCLVRIKISATLSASIISAHGRTGDQPCDLITCRVYSEQNCDVNRNRFLTTATI